MPTATQALNYSNTYQATTLSAGVTAAATTITVGSVTGAPAVPYKLTLERNNAALTEVVLVTAATGTSLTVTRGYDGTTAAAHGINVPVEHTTTAQDIQLTMDHARTASVSTAHSAVVQADVTGGYMDLANAQTIAGAKTFSSTLAAPSITVNALATIGTANGTYGSLDIAGMRGGWAGISFSSIGNVSYMLSNSQAGIYDNAGGGWRWRFTGAVYGTAGEWALDQGTVPASRVTPGTFAAGNFAFVGNTTLNGATTGPALTISAASTGRGAEILLSDTTASQTTPSKSIRSLSGQFQIVNSAYSAAILQLTDAGNLSVTGTINSAGNLLENNVRVYSASNPPPYPVTSVAGRSGAVVLTAADIGAGTFPAGLSRIQQVSYGATTQAAYSNANQIYLDGVADTVNHVRLAFHLGSVVASQIGMDRAGTIRTYDNPGTGYATFAAGAIYGTSVYDNGNRVYSNSNPITAANVGGGTFPAASFGFPNVVSFSTLPNGAGVERLVYGLRSTLGVTGGGTIAFDGSANFTWGSRFIYIGQGNGTSASTSGYFDIDRPAAGVALNVAGGAGARNWAAAGVLINGWEALWYVLPIGATNTSVPGNFWVTSYTAAMAPPSSDWILLAVRNGDDGTLRVCTGHKMVVGSSVPSTGFGGSAIYDYATRVYSSNNAPPYPVTSVATRTGAVTLTAADIAAGTFPGAYTITGALSLSSTLAVGGNTYSANAGAYTPTSVAGSKGGYAGFRFTDVDVSLMLNPTGNTGFYKETAGTWMVYWDSAGVMQAGTVPAARLTAGTLGAGTYVIAPGNATALSVAYNGATADNAIYGVIGATGPASVNTAYYSMTASGNSVWGMGIGADNAMRLGVINTGRVMGANVVRIDASGNVSTPGTITSTGNASFNGALIGNGVVNGFYYDGNVALRGADIYFQNNGAGGNTTYGRWTTAGLRIGDGNSPASRLDVVGTITQTRPSYFRGFLSVES